MASLKALTINKGKSFLQKVRWEEEDVTYKAITAVTQAAPCEVSVASHGLPDGWRVQVESVKGMTDVNSKNSSHWYKVKPENSGTISLSEVNSLGFKPYISGGVIKYHAPVDLTGCTARMSIKDKVGGAIIATSLAEHAPLNTLTVTVDIPNTCIEVTMSAEDSAVVNAKKGVYDLEVISATGFVTGLIYGPVTFPSEVTT